MTNNNKTSRTSRELDVTGFLLRLVATTVLAIDLSWSHLWRRLTGQFEVDDT